MIATRALAVRILPAPVVEQPAPRPPAAGTETQRFQASRRAGGRVQAGPTLPAGQATVADTAEILQASPPAEAASAPKPLDLSVRRADALHTNPLNAALADPRSNSPRLSDGERMAQALGTDTRLVEETHPDGSVRIRQGASCYDSRESRAASLDSFNSALHPSPRLVSAC